MLSCIGFIILAATNDFAQTKTLDDTNYTQRQLNGLARQASKTDDSIVSLSSSMAKQAERIAILETIAETQTWWFRAIGAAIIGLLFRDFMPAFHRNK